MRCMRVAGYVFFFYENDGNAVLRSFMASSPEEAREKGREIEHQSNFLRWLLDDLEKQIKLCDWGRVVLRG